VPDPESTAAEAVRLPTQQWDDRETSLVTEKQPTGAKAFASTASHRIDRE
jgi:hypothetical protein